jgi:hypothetical protein
VAKRSGDTAFGGAAGGEALSTRSIPIFAVTPSGILHTITELLQLPHPLPLQAAWRYRFPPHSKFAPFAYVALRVFYNITR